MARSIDRRAPAALAGRRPACLCPVFLYACRRSHWLALRYFLLRRPAVHPAIGLGRRFLLPPGLYVAHAREGRRLDVRIAADPARWSCALRWRCPATSHQPFARG